MTRPQDEVNENNAHGKNNELRKTIMMIAHWHKNLNNEKTFKISSFVKT